ncbi:MAG: DUF1819 family protein [Candidatus Promineifilaceae bacterium]
MPSAEKYSMSFTSGTLSYYQSLIIARLYQQEDDWDTVRKLAVVENRLQTRTVKTAKTMYRVIASRLKLLDSAEFTLLLNGTHSEQTHLLWLAVCRRYRYIYDFAVEVLREKYLNLTYELTDDDYWAYFNAKSAWHAEVANVADSTRKKQRQVIFKMLKEAELLTEGRQIIPALLTPRLVQTIAQHNSADLRIYPIDLQDLSVKLNDPRQNL